MPTPKVRIILADDEMMVRENLAIYLEDCGYLIKTATDGKEALDLFHQERPDVIITDISLPRMSGLELIRAIKSIAPQVPVIVCSGLGDMTDAIAALRLGIWDYLVKPMNDLSVVHQSIQKALEKQRLKDENERIRETLLEDQEAGHSVQQKILPLNLFEAPPLKLEHQVVPMLYLSGDFVDYFKLDDHRFVFYLADVSGHGAAAAFVTVLVKMFIREMAAKFRSDNDARVITPHLMIKALAQEIYGAKLGKYCTMLYFVYDSNLEEIHYSVAGHYPNPVLVRKGEAKYLQGRGFPVGISQSMSYKTEILELEPPFTLALFSDGIFEIMPGNFDNKEELLLKLLLETDLSLAQVNDKFKITSTPDRLDDVSVLLFTRGIAE